ncbi:FkbM family methyltransferase [Candidatus Nitrospira salsa]
MKRYYCTYFDKNYLVRVLALLESLHRHEQNQFTLFAVCMDELSRAILEKMNLENVISVPLHQIEYRDDRLVSTKSSRSLVEYYWTTTPTIILYLIEQYPEIDVLTYVDADLFFFSSPDPIFQELHQQSILLHEHRFSSSLLHLAQNNGKYNVGLLCFRNDTHGLEALRWWRERCLEWCFSRYEDGKLGDQMYLDDWSTRFQQVVELQHIGGGLGPWNQEQYAIRKNEFGEACVNDLPVIFYHFHALRFVSPELIVPVDHLHYPMNLSVLQVCYLPYISALSQALRNLTTISPEFTSGLRSEETISTAHCIFAKIELANALKSKNIPQILIPMDSEWNCYCPEQTAGVQERVDAGLQEETCPTGREQNTIEFKETPVGDCSRSIYQTIQDQYELFRTLQNNPLVHTVHTIYIIGAHLFQEQAMLQRLLPNLHHIYLFEPIPECYTYLKKITVHDSRIQVFPYAISQSDGPVEFFLTDNQGESSSLLPMGKHREIFPSVHHINTITIESRHLEHVIQEYNLVKPDMLFLDVQGAEYQILSSLSEDLLSHIQLIYAEASLEELYEGSKTLQDLRKVLHEHFIFAGYAPMSEQTPTHGNALFTTRETKIIGEGVALVSTEKSEPLISVIVSTYNAFEFIRECLDDLERQSLAEQVEIIVVDAASPQQEKDIVLEYQERYGNIVYIRTPERITVYAAWNLAIRAARGKYITPFSTNDRLRKNAYEILVNVLEEHQEIPLVYGDTYLTRIPHESFECHTRSGKTQWPPYSFEDLLNNCRVGPHPMWRKDIHDTIGYFDEQFRAVGDQDFWLRIGEQYNLMYIPEVTGLYWLSPDGLSNQDDIVTPELNSIRRKHRERYALRISQTQAVNFDCSIVIPVYNKVDLTKQCLTQLAMVTDGVSYEVIVVDNNSTDGTEAFLETLEGDVQIIRNTENLGFAKACNQGARAARGKYLVFLNNDTIPQREWLSVLVKEAEADNDIAIVGSKLLFEDGTLQHAGVVISRCLLIPYHIYGNLQGDVRCANHRRELHAVTAACMLVKRKFFDEVEGFDEAYRNGFEDTDLCLKIGEKGGKIVYQPESWMYHLESQSPGRKEYEEDNAALFKERWDKKYIVDEDCIAIEDGMAVLLTEKDGNFSISYRMLKDEKEYASWAKVAQLQRFLQEFGRENKSEIRRESLLNEIRQLVCDLEAWPKDSSVVVWIGSICDTLGFHALGDMFFRQALHVGESQDARSRLVRLALNQGNLEEASLHLSALLEVAPNESFVLHLQGVYFMQCKNFVEAKESFEKVITNDGDRIKAQLGMGMAYVGMGETRKAWDVFIKTVYERPDDTEAINWVLRTGTELADWESLSTMLSRFLERNPANGDMRFALASVSLRLGKVDDAQAQLNALQLLHPDLEGLADLKNAILSFDPHTVPVAIHG